MSVTPPISSFFGLDPRFLASPAASSALINPLLFGSSFQMVPINFGPFYTGIPPIFGGSGFSGLQTVPFNFFSQPSSLISPFSGGAAFGSGFGTSPFFGPAVSTPLTFTQQAVNPFQGFTNQSPFQIGATNPFQQQSSLAGLFGAQQQNPLASLFGGFGGAQTGFGLNGFF